MRPGWRAAIGALLSVALIYWTLRGVSISDVGARLSHANMLLFAAATFCATAIFALRARRWRTILEPVAGTLPLGPQWRATTIGMMVNNVVPA
ncbi:MAG TPA: lysylphosphatidylglycerol synthase domain-containing protein, partial [Gemmatimonadaceae bacterium]|nr:lysylphosphatidylglycerol synthase domain-containing protein [Gemmatimonadaceae bacterium]